MTRPIARISLALLAACWWLTCATAGAGEPAALQQDPRQAKIGEAVRQALARFDIPGASVAVIDDYGIAWAEGYGVLSAESEATVTPDTRFQAASISKPVAAAATLRLAEQGKLDLNAEVNDVLKSWQVPDGKVKKHRMQVRQLLSHTAGLTVHGFPGYEPSAPRPSLVEILDGKPPANTAAIRPFIKPGYTYSYSGGGYSVLQLLLGDVTGLPFPQLMHVQVLEPLAMAHSTYEQPLPAALQSQAARGHRAKQKVLEGGCNVYPEMAAAGLWTTPSDLSRFAIDVARCHQGQGGKLFSQATAREMLTEVRGNYGLGFAVNGSGDALRFNHGGANEGFRCILVAVPATGQGIAIMTNSDDGGRIFPDLVKLAGELYAWPKPEE